MEPSCVGIYGETCAGKSTLGKYLGSAMGCSYISFGDLKREEIARGTTVGSAIKQLLTQNCPLPAKLGYSVIESRMTKRLNFVSGYPISIDEFDVLSLCISMIGIITLSVDERVLVQRFGVRRECPKCHFPGVVGDFCSVHKIPMTQREDVGVDELVARRKLYHQRITPFLESKQIQNLPRLSLDSSIFSKGDIARQAKCWADELIKKEA